MLFYSSIKKFTKGGRTSDKEAGLGSFHLDAHIFEILSFLSFKIPVADQSLDGLHLTNVFKSLARISTMDPEFV